MTDFLTASGLVLTVLLAYLQIQRNQASAIRAQEEHLRNQLKLGLYEKAAGVFAEAAHRLTGLASKVGSVVMTLRLNVKGHPLPLDVNSEELIVASTEATRSISNVLITLEQHEIVFSRFGSFRRELSLSHEGLLRAFSDLWTKLASYVPLLDRKTGQLVGPLSKPSQNDVSEIEALQERHDAVCGDLQGYLIDLQIEAQNELLGELFQRQLPPRAPQDPNVKVLKRDALHPTARPRGGLV